jgi:hypothetical protein
MRRRFPSRLVLAALAVAPLLAIAGCGAPSAEERRAKRADYVRDAEAACVTMSKELSSIRDPQSFVALGSYITSGEKAVGDGAKRLHDLRGTLGDSATPEIKAFDGRIDPARDAIKPVSASVESTVLHASAKQARAIGAAAERARRAFDGLYQAGRTAKLDSCGRGGNRLADNALYTPYRDRMLAVLNAAARGRRGRIVINGNRGHDRRAVVQDLRREIPRLRRLRRLNAPLKLRVAHRRYVRADAEQVRQKQRMNALLAAPLPNYSRVSVAIDKTNAAVKRVNARGRRLIARLDLRDGR